MEKISGWFLLFCNSEAPLAPGRWKESQDCVFALGMMFCQRSVLGTRKCTDWYHNAHIGHHHWIKWQGVLLLIIQFQLCQNEKWGRDISIIIISSSIQVGEAADLVQRVVSATEQIDSGLFQHQTYIGQRWINHSFLPLLGSREKVRVKEGNPCSWTEHTNSIRETAEQHVTGPGAWVGW